MKIDKLYFDKGEWHQDETVCEPGSVDIVFIFGDFDVIKSHDHHLLLKELYPDAHIVGASTAGNILDNAVSEYGAVATAVSFDNGHVVVKSINHLNNDELYEDAASLVQSFEKEGLRHFFVLADGLKINGSELTRGLKSTGDITVTGGLAGDSLVFEDTLVIADGPADDNMAVAVGFYGESLHVSIGCKAGWEEFGAERTVTRSIGNIIYEIDNRPALELYEAYLGEFIKDLPASGLLFPLNVKEYDGDNEVIRVMMAINDDKSVVFAGDIPEGSTIRLMKTNIDNLIDGATLVANAIKPYNDKRSLVLAVSCSGRRSVLKQLVDEEVEAVQSVLGKEAQIVGYYSYGEIAPFSDNPLDCKLHNQTMTLTAIYED